MRNLYTGYYLVFDDCVDRRLQLLVLPVIIDISARTKAHYASPAKAASPKEQHCYPWVGDEGQWSSNQYLIDH